jgi:hypothetical protein
MGLTGGATHLNPNDQKFNGKVITNGKVAPVVPEFQAISRLFVRPRNVAGQPIQVEKGKMSGKRRSPLTKLYMQCRSRVSES